MFGRLMPREGEFFNFFNEHAEQIVLGAEQLKALMSAVQELDERKRAIDNIEHRADKITQQTMQLLHQTFITPIDRDEIHQLITSRPRSTAWATAATTRRRPWASSGCC